MFAYMHYQLNGDWTAMQTKMHVSDAGNSLEQLWGNLVACTARAGPLLETYVAAVVRGRPLQYAFALAVSCLSKVERNKLLAATKPEDRAALQQALSQAAPSEPAEPGRRTWQYAAQHSMSQQQSTALQLPPKGPRSSDMSSGGQQGPAASADAATFTAAPTGNDSRAGHASWPPALNMTLNGSSSAAALGGSHAPSSAAGQSYHSNGQQEQHQWQQQPTWVSQPQNHAAPMTFSMHTPQSAHLLLRQELEQQQLQVRQELEQQQLQERQQQQPPLTSRQPHVPSGAVNPAAAAAAASGPAAAQQQAPEPTAADAARPSVSSLVQLMTEQDPNAAAWAATAEQAYASGDMKAFSAIIMLQESRRMAHEEQQQPKQPLQKHPGPTPAATPAKAEHDATSDDAQMRQQSSSHTKPQAAAAAGGVAAVAVSNAQNAPVDVPFPQAAVAAAGAVRQQQQQQQALQAAPAEQDQARLQREEALQRETSNLLQQLAGDASRVASGHRAAATTASSVAAGAAAAHASAACQAARSRCTTASAAGQP